MPNKKRFKIGNTTLNLEKINDIQRRNTDFFTITITGCGCGINYSTLPPTNITCNGYTPHIVSQNCCYGLSPYFTDTIPTITGCGGCGKNYSTVPSTTLVQDSIDPSIDLQKVKESLVTQLKEIEAYELELETQGIPQTIEEMDGLENELENSLKELRELKKNFKG